MSLQISGKKGRGYSILELVVAVAIMSIVSVITLKLSAEGFTESRRVSDSQYKRSMAHASLRAMTLALTDASTLSPDFRIAAAGDTITFNFRETVGQNPTWSPPISFFLGSEGLLRVDPATTVLNGLADSFSVQNTTGTNVRLVVGSTANNGSPPPRYLEHQTVVLPE